MRKLQFLALILCSICLVLSSGAQTVSSTWNWADVLANSNGVKRIVITPVDDVIPSPYFLLQRPITITALSNPGITNGSFTTNIFTGVNIKVDVSDGWSTYTTNYFFPTNLAGSSVNAYNYRGFAALWRFAFSSPIVSNITYSIAGGSGLTNVLNTNASIFSVSGGILLGPTNFDVGGSAAAERNALIATNAQTLTALTAGTNAAVAGAQAGAQATVILSNTVILATVTNLTMAERNALIATNTLLLADITAERNALIATNSQTLTALTAGTNAAVAGAQATVILSNTVILATVTNLTTAERNALIATNTLLLADITAERNALIATNTANLVITTNLVNAITVSAGIASLNGNGTNIVLTNSQAITVTNLIIPANGYISILPPNGGGLPAPIGIGNGWTIIGGQSQAASSFTASGITIGSNSPAPYGEIGSFVVGTSNDVGGNLASGNVSTYNTILGGSKNTTPSRVDYATISGGQSNSVSGNYSSAQGFMASAAHNGSWVWSSWGSSMSTTGTNQFLVNTPGGGEGINTNSLGGAALNVLGTINASVITIAGVPISGNTNGLTTTNAAVLQNSSASNIVAIGTTSLGGNTNWMAQGPSIVSIWNGGSTRGNGTYQQISGNGLTNLSALAFGVSGVGISSNGTSFFITDNGTNLYSALSLAGPWAVVAGIAPVPVSWIGASNQVTGIHPVGYMDFGTNGWMQITNAAATNAALFARHATNNLPTSAFVGITNNETRSVTLNNSLTIAADSQPGGTSGSFSVATDSRTDNQAAGTISLSARGGTGGNDGNGGTVNILADSLQQNGGTINISAFGNQVGTINIGGDSVNLSGPTTATNLSGIFYGNGAGLSNVVVATTNIFGQIAISSLTNAGALWTNRANFVATNNGKLSTNFTYQIAQNLSNFVNQSVGSITSVLTSVNVTTNLNINGRSEQAIDTGGISLLGSSNAVNFVYTNRGDSIYTNSGSGFYITFAGGLWILKDGSGNSLFFRATSPQGQWSANFISTNPPTGDWRRISDFGSGGNAEALVLTNIPASAISGTIPSGDLPNNLLTNNNNSGNALFLTNTANSIATLQLTNGGFLKFLANGDIKQEFNGVTNIFSITATGLTISVIGAGKTNQLSLNTNSVGGALAAVPQATNGWDGGRTLTTNQQGVVYVNSLGPTPDFTNWTPNFIGQILADGLNRANPLALWAAVSTTKGDLPGGFSFPSGIATVGGADMGTNITGNMTWTFNGNTNFQGTNMSGSDNYFEVINYNTYGSGSGIQVSRAGLDSTGKSVKSINLAWGLQVVATNAGWGREFSQTNLWPANGGGGFLNGGFSTLGGNDTKYLIGYKPANFAGEPGSINGNHYSMGMNMTNSGIWRINFPWQTANVFDFANTNGRDLLLLDEFNGVTVFGGASLVLSNANIVFPFTVPAVTVSNINATNINMAYLGGTVTLSSTNITVGLNGTGNLGKISADKFTGSSAGNISDRIDFDCYGNGTGVGHGSFLFEILQGGTVGFKMDTTGFAPRFLGNLSVISNLFANTITATNGFTGNGNGLTNLSTIAAPYRSGLTNMPNLATTAAIAFSVPLNPNAGTNYMVDFGEEGSFAATSFAYATAKTTNGFTLNLTTGITGGGIVTWHAEPYTQTNNVSVGY